MNPVNKILGKDPSKDRFGDPGDNPDDRPLVDDSALTPVSVRPSLNPVLNRKRCYRK